MNDKAPRKDNNFGALRLLFASVVILSHSAEIVDGDRSREVLTNIFGTLTFGILGVDGFFIISGYLITKSLLSSPSLLDYAKRRVLRIYPAFIVCFWLCLLVLAPLVGARLSVFHPAALARSFVRMALLFHPNAKGVFPGMPLPGLNGSMWSIPYEFQCYIFVVLLSAAGFLRGALRYVLLVAVLAAVTIFGIADYRTSHSVFGVMIGGSCYLYLQTFPMFLAGTLYFLFQRNIIYNHALAAAAAVLLIICLFFQPLVAFALAVFGGYLIFWFAPPESGFADQPVHEQDRLVLWDLPLCVADPINDRVLHRPVNQPLGALGRYFGARLGGGLGELDIHREASSGAGPSQQVHDLATPIKRGSAA